MFVCTYILIYVVDDGRVTRPSSMPSLLSHGDISLQVLCQSDARRPTTPSSELILNRSRTPTPAREFDIQV